MEGAPRTRRRSQAAHSDRPHTVAGAVGRARAPEPERVRALLPGQPRAPAEGRERELEPARALLQAEGRAPELEPAPRAGELEQGQAPDRAGTTRLRASARWRPRRPSQLLRQPSSPKESDVPDEPCAKDRPETPLGRASDPRAWLPNRDRCFSVALPK